MIYQDKIYGKIKIEEPVILELIKNFSLQRLKGIDQAGYFPLFSDLLSLPASAKHNRFEHSLGVFILLKRFKASLKEQIAGLIHDVSHGAFSHGIDYILDGGSEKKQTYQDDIFEKFVKNSEIPETLKKYDFDVDYILNEHNFPLLERKLPDLCADRIDYSLRTAFSYNVENSKMINYFLDSLEVRDNFWVFKDYKSAKEFAELFLKLNRIYYAGFPTAVMFRTIGDLLKYALNKKYLLEKDLFTNDENVLNKIKESLDFDENLRLLWDRANNKIKAQKVYQDYDAHIFLKSRIVDPLFKIGDEIKRVSKVDENWAKLVKTESEPKEYSMKFKYEKI